MKMTMTRDWPPELRQHDRELLADAAVVVDLGLRIQEYSIYGLFSRESQRDLENAIANLKAVLHKIHPLHG